MGKLHYLYTHVLSSGRLSSIMYSSERNDKCMISVFSTKLFKSRHILLKFLYQSREVGDHEHVC